MVDAANRHGEREEEEGARGGVVRRGAAHWLRRGAAAAAIVAAVAGAVVWAGSGRSQGVVLGASRSVSGRPRAMAPSAYMDPNDNDKLEYRSADTSGLGFAGGGDPYKYIETGHYAKILAREDQIVHGWVDGASAKHSAKQGVKQALASVEPAGGAAAAAAEQHAAKMRALHRVAVAERFAHGIMLDDGGQNETYGNGTLGNRAVAGFTGGANGTCLQPPRLHAFFVNQLFWTWVHTLEVSGVIKDANGKDTTIKLGHVKAEPFSFVSKQAWTNLDGKVIASSHQDAITTVTNIYVEDCAKKAIATISENLAPSSSAVSQYTIENGDGDIVGISTMSRNFGTEVDINDQESGKRLVSVSKGWGQITDAWSATFREDQKQTLANEPRVIVMLLAAASASGSWGLGGPLGVLLNPIWLLLLFCLLCAGCTAYARAQETQYDEIPSANTGGPFFGQGYTTGYGTGGGTFGGTQYV